MKETYNAISARGGKTAVCVISLGAEGVDWNGPDRAVKALQDGGCVVVKAGGDVGKDSCNFTPARAPEGLTVAILDRNGQSLTYYSNTGRCIHLAAPGHEIVSASHRGGFTTRSGSSFAAPHVAGAAALILGQEPWLKPQQVVDRILSRASHGVLGGDLKGTPNRVVYVRP
ncbi:peptidase S8/S53 domain-containing protein [Catenaria anguillulae PL171]|uniref:Peptidase S8/S53 domain-containing protein n=1 Tax=Catenaria anguillulae PL171 TaxID=765915 RepID=A0A1Y2HGP7_9FUNG|nr:peptidase S8/S53 domain-containing protein [Catenaria anguillulae PL171]